MGARIPQTSSPGRFRVSGFKVQGEGFSRFRVYGVGSFHALSHCLAIGLATIWGLIKVSPKP